MKKTYIRPFIGGAVFSILIIIFLATGLWRNFYHSKPEEQHGTIIITPGNAGLSSASDRQPAWDEGKTTKIPMEDGEIVYAIFNKDREEILAEEQFVIFGNTYNAARELYLTYIGFDEGSRRYRRMWNIPVAATRAETISILSQDIIGDRNNCIIVTGMNNRNEHTMTVFRRGSYVGDQSFDKIAELQIDGSIIIQETGRSLAYQQGIAKGQSYSIATYGHDNLSNNILDQIETIYSFNDDSGQYEQADVSRIPGSQIEQRQLREILSGIPGVFENFINDLWYYVSPQGTVDTRQYIYFDPSGREIIFYGDGAQQVFNWHNSTYTRYGLYIRSQNISISTLLRFIDIELESLDSIKLRVIEDVQLKISISTSWDGSYRRAGAVALNEPASSVRPAINAAYDSSLGRIIFSDTGEYTINSGNTSRKGRYVFYKVDGNELLEFRSGEKSENDNRTIYKVETTGSSSLSLSRVRLGTAGIQDLFETAIILTPVEN